MARSQVASYTFRRIASDLDTQIASGDLPVGEPIPSILSLAQRYRVAPMTVRRAISSLCASGRLQTLPGRGTFVSKGPALGGVTLVIDFDEWVAQNQLLAQHDTLAGAQDACVEAGVSLNIVRVSSDPTPWAVPGRGVLFCLTSAESAALVPWVSAVLERRIPHISVGMDAGLANYAAPDGFAAGRKSVEHLRALGHRRIAILPRIGFMGKLRFDVRPSDIPDDVELSCFPYHQTVDGPEMDRVMTEKIDAVLALPRRPTALVAGPDQPVITLLRLLAARGIRVPGDMSVLGYCRRAFASWGERRITRFDNPHRKVAFCAVRELFKAAAGGGYAPGRVAVEPDFFDGDTCGPVPADAAGGR